MNVIRLNGFGSLLRFGKPNFPANCAISAAVLNEGSKLRVCSSQRWVSTVDAKTLVKDDGLAQRIMKKIGFMAVTKYKVKGSAYLLYEGIVDKINYLQFFEEFDIPDTFYSWFVITELHIWMISARAMAEDQEGRCLRNALVEALWSDVGQRIKKIGARSTTEMKDQITELSEQLQAALIAYDEGIQSSDIVLAGALWRRLYQMGPVNVKYLDVLVKYVRKQMTLLDNTSKDQIFNERRIDWIPIT